MVKIHFTSALHRFFPKLETMEVDAGNMHEVIEGADKEYPGIKSFILEDNGELRKHVNLFVGENIADLETDLKLNDEIFIFQALSGG